MARIRLLTAHALPGAIVEERFTVDQAMHRKADLLLLGGLIAAAAALRFSLLGARSFWFDEAFSVTVARLPLGQIVRYVAQTDPHPPLYYLLLHGWLRLADSPEMARALSMIFGILTILATWGLARTVGGRGLAAVAGVLAAVAALGIQASVEARMYPLLSLLVVTSTLLLWKATEESLRRWPWPAYVVTMAAALYVHYFAFLLVPAHLVFVLLYRRHSVRSMLVAVGAALLAFGPWWPVVFDQVRAGNASPVWKGVMPPTAPLNIVALSSFGGYLLGLGGYLVDHRRWAPSQLLLVLPFLALAATGAVAMGRRGAGTLMTAAWGIPLLALVAASLATGIFYAIPRYASFVQPFFLLLLAQGILTVSARGRRVVPVLVLTAVIVLNLTVLGLTLADPAYQPYDWAGASRHVRAHWQPGDGLIFYPGPARVAFGYYFPVSGAPAATLSPPSWDARLTRAQLVRGIPSFPALVKDAGRFWFILTEPLPVEVGKALMEAADRSYVRRQVLDFRYVYVLLYEHR
ncbi:MAG: glycosyltransferase family 39 protein [bacterium]